jgi:hypothetical protein
MSCCTRYRVGNLKTSSLGFSGGRALTVLVEDFVRYGVQSISSSCGAVVGSLSVFMSFVVGAVPEILIVLVSVILFVFSIPLRGLESALLKERKKHCLNLLNSSGTFNFSLLSVVLIATVVKV